MSNNQKIPKAGFEPSVKKEAKFKHEPQNYLSFPVSWQIGQIDFDSTWHAGLMRSRFIYRITEEVENLLIELYNTDNDAANKIEKYLREIDNREFHDSEEFYNHLNLGVGCEVPNSIIGAVSKEIKDFYFWKEIFPHMKNLESMTWNDVKNATHGKGNKSNSHEISIGDLNKDAKRRLTALKLEDVGSVYSLRIGGTLRIFGIRHMSFLKILWFDENHEVCPQDIQARGKNFS